MIVETAIIVTLTGSPQRAFTALKAGGGNASTDAEIVEDRYSRKFELVNEGANPVFIKFGPRTGSIGTLDTTTASRKVAAGAAIPFEVDNRFEHTGEGFAFSSLHLNGTAADVVRIRYQERI